MDSEKRILQALKDRSLTIEEVAQAVGLHRITVSKYLAVLEAKGLVKRRDIGPAKLYSLAAGEEG